MSHILPEYIREVELGLSRIQEVRSKAEGAIKEFVAVFAQARGVDANDARAIAALRATLDPETQSNWKQFDDLIAQFDKIHAALPKILHALKTTACCDLSEFDAAAIYPMFMKGDWPVCSLIEGVPNKRSCGLCRIRVFWSADALQVHLSESASASAASKNI